MGANQGAEENPNKINIPNSNGHLQSTPSGHLLATPSGHIVPNGHLIGSNYQNGNLLRANLNNQDQTRGAGKRNLEK